MILRLSLVAFIFDTGRCSFAKIINLFPKRIKINPMIGAAGISASRCPQGYSQNGLKEITRTSADARGGLNVSGQIASVIAAV